ncbi:MAG: Ig-like domain repeat protein, partial [Clostridia bacterium]|nr:Ig-like domain repeat protein [Clostridia bacterium]
MKKAISVLLSFVMLLGAVAVGGMSVSANIQVYEISSYAELKEFAVIVNGNDEVDPKIYPNPSACATLLNDIDATGYNDWVPIAKDGGNPFTGTFDGRGFKIDGLGISRAAGKNNIGLFGFIGEGGSVRDVNLTSADFNSYDGYYYNGSNFGGIAHENKGAISGCSFDGTIVCGGGAGGIACDNYGTITDCYCKGAVSGDRPVGGIAGNNREGTITNCYNIASITGDINGKGSSFAGGIAGSNVNGTITNCYNTGDVTGHDSVGGIAGSNGNNGKITDCYNTGSVTGNSNVGGVAGYMSISNSSQNCTLTNCYNTGSVTLSGDNAQYAGGVLGYLYGGTVENCFYDNEKCDCEKAVSNTDDTSNVKGLTTAQMTGDNALNNMTFSYSQGETNPWLTKANDDNYLYYPHLKGFNLENGEQIPAEYIQPDNWPAKEAREVYAISNYDELKAFAVIVNGNDEVDPKIDPNPSACAYLTANIVANANDWVPIGKDSAYTGTFDGRGCSIKGLSISKKYVDNIGFFGYIGDGGAVIDVNLTNTVFSSYAGGSYRGRNYGGIAHENKGTISGCSFDGTVACNGAAGGIACDNYGTIKDCYSKGAVSGEQPVGGIAGSNGGTITNCYNTASINGDIKINNSSNTGGIAGGNGGTIKNCYNTGKVTGTSNAGGVAGSNMNGGTVTDCYNTGSVTGRQCVGGVVGYLSTNNSAWVTTVRNCFNTGAVTIQGDNAQYSGGVLGYLGSATVENCFYDSQKCALEKAFGNADNTDSVKGLTTAQMTGDNALNNMTFSYAQGETNPWLTKANDDNYLYYPHLKGFNLENGEQISAENIDPENWPPKFEIIIPEMELAAPGADYGKMATVTANLPSDAVSCEVTFYLDGDETGKSVSVSEGKAVCEYTGLTIGEHTVRAVFSGDGRYKGVTDSITFNVNSVDCALTINYVYADGTEAAETYDGRVTIFNEYSVTSPEITGYTPDIATVEGTMGDEDLDGKTVTVTYTANEYSITYVIDGNETVATYKFGAAVAKPADPVKDGFKFTGWDKEIPETMPAENLTITAEFEENPTPTEPTPTEPTPTEPTPTEPTPTEPTPTEPTPTEPTSTDTEPVHEHSYKEEVTTKPTCTEDGVMTYTCECGETYTQAIPKTGHKPGAWEIVTPATTEAAGKEVRKCSVCGEVIEEREIAKLETDTALADAKAAAKKAIDDACPEGVSDEVLKIAEEAKNKIDKADSVKKVDEEKNNGL